MDESDKEDEFKKSCCTWPKIVVAAILTVTSCVVLWKFAPIDKAIDSVLPKFNKTSGEYTGIGDAFGDIPPTQAPSLPDRFNFMQCRQGKECCNGLTKICHLGVDEIVYATAHNAMASFEDGFLFGPNHRLQLERALLAGYRGINLDICNCAGLLVFCHGYCSLGIRDFDEVFASINGFLDSNPTEVLMMPLEINNFADEPVDLDQFYFQMTQTPGLTEKIYVHENADAPWPTLKEAVDSNKRIFMFHFNGPDCTTEDPCPPGLHLYDKYAINTNWEFRNLEDVEDIEASCDLALKEALSHQSFFGVNNFLSPPSYAISKTLNSVDFARERIRACSEKANLDVNFIYADFWSEGALPELVQEHNRELARRRQRTLRRAN
ncbi:MAG: hypothetical protein SGBAC_002355 [Bacillariaceae sp.]